MAQKLPKNRLVQKNVAVPVRNRTNREDEESEDCLGRYGLKRRHLGRLIVSYRVQKARSDGSLA